MSRLRQVLHIVQGSGGAVTLGELAARLEVQPALAAEMVAFWERRGALAPSVAGMVICVDSCSACGVESCGARSR